MENFSIWEESYQHDEQNSRPENAGASASSASSPGRRALTSPPARKSWDVFTHLGNTYRILRMMPGSFPGEPIKPHHPVLAEIPTWTGTPQIHARATARTPHLVHVVWEDDMGETYGAWLPKRSTTDDILRSNTPNKNNP